MRRSILLDTHSLLWLVTEDSRLSEQARSVFLNPDHELFVSAVTDFEIAIKFSLEY